MALRKSFIPIGLILVLFVLAMSAKVQLDSAPGPNLIAALQKLLGNDVIIEVAGGPQLDPEDWGCVSFNGNISPSG